jgi:MFS family permease
MSSDTLVQKHIRRNYTLGVMNGAIFGFVDAISAPSLVLALFVAQLGGSNLLIGLLPAIYNGGWFLPQFLISHRLERLPLKKRPYLTAAVVRIICWGLIAIVTPLVGASNPTLLLSLFFVLYVTYSFAAGFAGNAFMTMVAKIIPLQRRGSFFGMRDLTGTASGILAGYLISLALAPQGGLTFPNNFGILFFITFAAVAVGLTVFGLVAEPRDTTSGREVTFREQTRAARRVWRENEMFRRYLTTRIVLALADVATPFYAIYATRQLGAPEQIVGLYVGLTTLSAMVTNPVWSWISDHRGNRPVLLAAAAAALTMPFVAFVFGLFRASPLLVTPFGLLFVFYGAGRTAGNIAFPTYLLEIAPASERSLYIGFTNTLLGIATFIPAGGGILLDLFGFAPLFIISLLIGAIGLWLARGLIEPSRAATRSLPLPP